MKKLRSNGSAYAVLRAVAFAAVLGLSVVALHRLGGLPTPLGVSGAVALGVVGLASYSLGQLCLLARLPAVSGYVTAGLLLGPWTAGLLPSHAPWRPLSEALLHATAVRELAPLEHMATALVSLLAAVAIDTKGLRTKGGAIVGLVGGQVFFIVLAAVGFVVALEHVGGFSQHGLNQGAWAALPMVLGPMMLAGSPAATAAVLAETRTEASYGGIILTVVVLNYVLAAVGLSVAAAFGGALVVSGSGDGLGQLGHTAGSLLGGLVLGAWLAFGARFVKRELLLFVVGGAYATFIASARLDFNPVLVFLVAGLIGRNFGQGGQRLVEAVQWLGTPAFVVFFTLIGSQLHFEGSVALLLWTFGLVLVRLGAVGLGAWGGASLVGASTRVRRLGWFGFAAQSGLLGFSVTPSLLHAWGEAGREVELIVSMAAGLNLLMGPLLLKLGLGFVAAEPEEEAPLTTSGARRPISLWPEPAVEMVWSKAPKTVSEELAIRTRDLQAELEALARHVAGDPIANFEEEAQTYLRELRREFLRYHRHLWVQAQSAESDLLGLAALLRSEQAELAERWRGSVLARATHLRLHRWDPKALVDGLDRIVESLPEQLRVPVEPRSFEPHGSDSMARATRRALLRVRRAVRRATGFAPMTRVVPLRKLARFHFSEGVTDRVEGLAALLVQADNHLSARTRSLFEGLVQGYDGLADRLGAGGFSPLDSLTVLRTEFEEELGLAREEITRIAKDGQGRALSTVAVGFRRFVKELPVAGTLDGTWRRGPSKRAWRTREKRLEALRLRLSDARAAGASGYALLALEFELIGLEARVKREVTEHVARLESDARGRGHIQAERVKGALEEARNALDHMIEQESQASVLAASVRKIGENVERVTSEAGRAADQLRDQLIDDKTVGPLLDAMVRAARALTDWYEVSAGRMPKSEWKLPSAMTTIEVPFRDLVATHIESVITPRLLAGIRQAAAGIHPYAATVQEIERLIAFNVEIAVGELDVLGEETVSEATRKLLRDTVGTAIERSFDSMVPQAERTLAWPDEVAEHIRSAVLGGIAELRTRLSAGDLSQERLESMRRSAARKRLLEEAGRIPGSVARIHRQLRALVRAWLGEDRLESWRRTMGIPVRRVSPAIDRALLAPPSQPQGLPLVYRRLFSPDTLEAADVLTGREPQIARAKAALSPETKGTLRSVVLVGPDGVGKGAVSSAIVRSLSWKNVRRLQLTSEATGRDVDDLFRAKSEGHLIVINGFHWLVAMRPHGFEHLRRLARGIVEDAGRNAWLIHADTLVWRYATTVAPLEEAVAELIELEPFGASELEAAILARHALSGYALSFEPRDQGTQLQRVLARGASRLRRPYETYFRALHATSGGLIRDALRLWLASIESIDDASDLIHIGAVPSAPLPALGRLPQETLLQLYQVSRQGWMNAAIHARLFRIDVHTAQAQLGHLQHLGLLVRHGDAYRIASHLRGNVLRVLAERGWL